MTTETKDLVVVGGGPGGLSAALALGLANKKVLLCDAGPPRNAAAVHMQTFLSRDGTPPRELRRIGREQLRPYDVEVRDVRVLGLERIGPRFRVALEGGGRVDARRVVLTTGMVDTSVPGIYAGGDLTTPIQGAILAASAGMFAAAMANHGLNLELAGARHG